MTKATIFISYAHKDEEWKDRVVTHLRVLEFEGLVDVWDDRRIEAGEEWHAEIENALNAASVAGLLITANFLTSKFILDNEVPQSLERRAKQGVRVIPLIVKPCAWQQVKWLSQIQARPKDGRALSAGNENQIDTDLAVFAQEIVGIAPPEDNGAQKLADIRKRLFVATTIPELVQLKYEIELFLTNYPTDVEGKILRDDIERARRWEMAQVRPPVCAPASPVRPANWNNSSLLIGCIIALITLIAIIINILQNWR